MSGHKGQSGPLTLRCPMCHRRNVGKDHPITAKNRPASYRKGKRLTWVGCECGWHWFTTHRSVAQPSNKEGEKRS